MYDQFQNIISRPELKKLHLPEEVQGILNKSASNLLETASNWIQIWLTQIISTLTSLPTIGFYIVICVLSLYFICTDKIYMLDQLEHHLPQLWVKRLIKHTKEIVKKLGGLLKAEAILVTISFIISLIGLYVFKFIGLKVEYPLLIAIGIGFVDALPIFGSGTVMIPWAIILACDGDYILSLAILGLWGTMSIVRQFIEPKIVSGQIGIHPIFTLLAMYTGFRFIGVMRNVNRTYFTYYT